MNYFKQYAEQMVEGGFSVIPIDGKKPLTNGWSKFCREKPDNLQMESWLSDARATGIGIPAGPANGLCFLDVDSYTEELCQFILQWVPHAKVRRIGAKGFVIPVKYEGQRVRKLKYKGIDVADILSDGRQVAALSIHPETKKPYVWHGVELEGVDLQELQSLAIRLDDQAIDKLEAALNAEDFTLHANDLAKVKVTDIGAKRVTGRNNALVEQISAAFYKSVPAEQTAQQVLDYDRKTHSPPLFEDPDELDTDISPLDHALRMTYSIYKSNAERLIRDKTTRAEPESASSPKSKIDMAKTVTILPFPDETDGGKRYNTLDNFIEMFRRLGVVCRYNETTKQDEVKLPGLKMSQANALNVVHAHLTSWGERCRLPTKNIGQYINAISDLNAYSPVREWIESKPWDGIERLPMLYDTVTAVGESDGATGLEIRTMKERLIELWVTSAVAAVFKPGSFSAHGVLVFLGAQNMGKTRWFKRLLPPHMSKYGIEGLVLDVHNKDSVMKAISHWLVELGEVDGTIRRSDVAALKAFITQDKDVQRRPFAKCDSHYPRQTVFFASVNDRKFLNDPTGNRRFWTIDCEKINAAHDIDMQQVFAEALVHWKKGAKTYLSQNELDALNEHNKEFTALHPLEEQIASYFLWENSDARMVRKTATEIAIMMGVRTPGYADTRVVSRVLRDRFNLKSDDKYNGRFYTVPVPDDFDKLP